MHVVHAQHLQICNPTAIKDSAWGSRIQWGIEEMKKLKFCLPLGSDQILIVQIYLKAGRISTVKSLQINLFMF